MYASDRFMEYAGTFLARPVQRKAIDEAKATREQLAAQRRANEDLAAKAALNRYIVTSSGEESPVARYLAEAARANPELMRGAYDELLKYARTSHLRPDFRTLFHTGVPPESTGAPAQSDQEPPEEKKEQAGGDAGDHS